VKGRRQPAREPGKIPRYRIAEVRQYHDVRKNQVKSLNNRIAEVRQYHDVRENQVKSRKN
jgi:hypothetical protein